MYKKIITYLITIVFLSKSTAINYSFLAVDMKDYALRPLSTVDGKSSGGTSSGTLPKLELQLLSRAMANYSPLFWLDFLKARGDTIDKDTARLIEKRARLKYTAMSSEDAYPILDPKKRYSLSGLMEIGDAYYKRRKKLNVVERMELCFIDKIRWERINFFRGERRSRSEMQQLAFKEAFNFAFGEVGPKKVRIALTSTGKIIYFTEDSPYAVKVDIGGNYFRVQDTRLRLSYSERSIQRYLQPGDGKEYKGPYLSKSFKRVLLHIKSRRKGYRLLLDEDYGKMTHFRIGGDPPFPMKLFSKKDTLTLLEACDILKSRLGIEDVQLCFSTELQERELLKPDDWYIEISKENKTARVYLKKEWFSFVQHFYKLREILPGRKAGKAKLLIPSEAQDRAGTPKVTDGLQERITTLTAFDVSA